MVSGESRPERARALLLCGMMGAGKSAVGRALAERLGRSFIDSDARIEAAAGASIPEIFERHGEAYFRELERQVLRGLPDRDVVVALGGGAVTSPENLSIIRSKGVLVLLRARAETLVGRLRTEASGRPLLQGVEPDDVLERIRALLSERTHAYRQADVSVDTDHRSVSEVRDAVLAALGWECAA